ncbi:MAG: [FeFe] hydrogenase H-cluster maturation GTPase HydF [Planctomycetaceae bacterium]|nr:[FeFe] hydrogenase H-cluster maturation GTPase HydF [Planctomycetaceae bacterium]
MQTTPRGMRLHIGIFGRRNAGKSSLLNMITAQNVSIVSEVAGTTTDPVEKPMELLPLGPVLFIDTAGIDDDAGTLGEERAHRTRLVFDRTELAILVIGDSRWTKFEEELRLEFRKRNIPLAVVFNKSDLHTPPEHLLRQLREEFQLPTVSVSALKREGFSELKRTLLENVSEEWISSPVLVSDLLPPDSLVVLVLPIDKEAPKGRLILPQVQVLRELLDHGHRSIVTRDTELPAALAALKEKPALVVTDSQAFRQVSQIVPEEIPLTGFSVLFARFKGDLTSFIDGTRAVSNLKEGDHVLIAESCSHHAIGDDIGRVKIPRWLQETVGGELHFHHVQGNDFPEDLTPYQLVIQCGGCMTNRRAILSRILRAREQNVPITNYGMIIAWSMGIFERAIQIIEK